jgi:hypothetical protein
MRQAMSHVLYPDYYGQNVGPHGRRMVEDLIAVVQDMGRTLSRPRPTPSWWSPTIT